MKGFSLQALTNPSIVMAYLVHVPWWAYAVLGFVVLVWLYTQYRAMLSFVKFAGFVVLLGAVGGVFYGVSNLLTSWQKASSKDANPNVSMFNGVLPNNLAKASHVKNPVNLARTNPLLHENPYVLALAVTALIVIIGYQVAKRVLSAEAKQRFLAGLRLERDKRQEGYVYTPVELGRNKVTGKAITVSGKDRFINVLLIGSIGTGKTSRILTKGVAQDLRSIADGNPMDVIVMDPDGGLIDDSITIARKLGIAIYLIDFRKEGRGQASNISFNPFSGGDVPEITDNVRAVLKEQMGQQDAFFQNTQDDLVRTVIQVQVPLFPDTDFLQFAQFITDPAQFRSICQLVSDMAAGKSILEISASKSVDPDVAQDYAEYLYQRLQQLSKSELDMVLSATRSFLADTRSEQKLEFIEKVTKGLKVVVNELSTNPTMRNVLGKGDLPSFDFVQFFEATKESKGRLVAIVTGNRPVGDLFGKLFMVSMKMYAMNRSGTENTRRPVYVYIDEFPRYATNSLADLFAQVRKYRVGLTLAIQTRAQLMLSSNKGFVNVVEGSCRNKIYFPAPSPEDAKYMETSLGKVRITEETHSKNVTSFLGFDGRIEAPKISTREKDESRFSLEDLLYKLRKNEAVFDMTVDNQHLEPVIGITTYATDWIQSQRNFYRLKQDEPKHSGGGWSVTLPKKVVRKPMLTEVPQETPKNYAKEALVKTGYRPSLSLVQEPKQQEVNDVQPDVQEKSKKIVDLMPQKEEISAPWQRQKENLTKLTEALSHTPKVSKDTFEEAMKGAQASQAMRNRYAQLQGDDSSIRPTRQRRVVDRHSKEVVQQTAETAVPDIPEKLSREEAKSEENVSSQEVHCKHCHQIMEIEKETEFSTYRRISYRCPAGHGQPVFTCKACGSVATTSRNTEFIEMHCPTCGMIERRQVTQNQKNE